MSETPIIQTIEKNGMLNLTKTYLQNKLLDTLKSQSTTASSLIKTGTLNKNSNIYSLIRLSYSLILDFLTKMNLSYSVSSFYNEAKDLLYNTNLPYTESEIINFLKINALEFKNEKNNILLESKDSMSINSYNFSSTFIYYLIKKNTFFFKNEESCQTEINLLTNPIEKSNLFNNEIKKNDFSNIDEKLKEIEEKNNKKLNLDKIFSSQLTENKFIKYKEECDKRYKEQLKNEINRIQVNEISKVRIEENKKYNEKILKLREEIEKEFKEREERLKNQLDELKERELKLEKEYEMKLNDDRRKIEDKINFLNNQENLMDNKIKNELDDIKIKKETLKLKEQELNYLKETQNSHIKNEIEKMKNNYESQLNKEKEKLNKEKEKLNNERSLFKNISNEKKNNYIYIKDDTNNNETDNNNNDENELKSEINNLKKEFDDIKNQYSKTINENVELKDKLDKINRNIPIYQNYDNINKSIVLRESMEKSNLNKINSEIPAEYKQIIKKNNNEITMLKQTINELQKDLKRGKYNKQNKNNNNDLMNYSSTDNFQNLNRTMPIQQSEILNKKSNEGDKKKSNNINQPISKRLTSNLAKKLSGFKDRRKVLEDLEKEQYKLNSELRTQFKHLINDNVPVVILNKETIDKMKENNTYNNLIYKNLEDDEIKYKDNLGNNYRIPNKEEQNRNVIIMNKENNQIIENNDYEQNYKNLEKDLIKNSKEFSKEKISQSIYLDDIKRSAAENSNQTMNNSQNKFTPIYREKNSIEYNNNTRYSNINDNNDNEINISKNKEKQNKEEITQSIKNLPSTNEMKNSDNFSVKNITMESREIPKNTIDNINLNVNSDTNSHKPISGIGGILNQNNNYIKKPSSNSIQEEIEESIVKSQYNNENKSINKFQNVDYESNNLKDEKDENEEIEEYNDFEYDISGNFDKKPDNIDKKIGSNNKGSIANLSGIIKNSVKDSLTGTHIEKLIPNKKSNSEIEENIGSDNVSYNDFENSNTLKNKGIVGNISSYNKVRTISESEIKEEINNSEESGF